MFCLAILCILCVIVESELLWVEWDAFQSSVRAQDARSSSADAEFAYSSAFVALKVILSSASALLLLGLVLRYRACSLFALVSCSGPGLNVVCGHGRIAVRYLGADQAASATNDVPPAFLQASHVRLSRLPNWSL